MRNTRSRRLGTEKRNRAERLKPEQRKRLIIDEAARLFAEHGFDAGTAELAERLGIAQPLIYRYFRNKEELLKRVYSEAYPVKPYYDEWERLISDNSVDIRERLVRFYTEYTELTWNYAYTRMAIWANLSRPRMNRIYYETVRQRIFPKIVRALRVAYGDPHSRAAPTERELELVHSLHGMLYHLAIRRWVHAKRLKGDVRPLIELKVDLFLRGAAQLVGRTQTRPQPNGAARPARSAD